MAPRLASYVWGLYVDSMEGRSHRQRDQPLESGASCPTLWASGCNAGTSRRGVALGVSVYLLDDPWNSGRRNNSLLGEPAAIRPREDLAGTTAWQLRMSHSEGLGGGWTSEIEEVWEAGLVSSNSTVWVAMTRSSTGVPTGKMLVEDSLLWTTWPEGRLIV